MTYHEQVGSYLQSIAPRGASNREIAASLGIRWPGSVYRATRQLAQEGVIRREREGRRWVFCVESVGVSALNEAVVAVPPKTDVVSAPVEETAPVEDWRRKWLRPLLQQPDGRAWFLERLRCPCTSEQARTAEVSFRRRPLRDLIEQDYAACGGGVPAQERMVSTYNALFNLPDGCGIHQVWHADRAGEMRLPAQGVGKGWTAKQLRKHIGHKRYLRRALKVLRLAQTRVDAIIVAGSYVVLVLCAQDDAITERRYARQKALAGVLERRLDKRFFLAGVVAGTEQLGVLDLAHVRWDEIRAWLANHTTEM